MFYSFNVRISFMRGINLQWGASRSNQNDNWTHQLSRVIQITGNRGELHHAFMHITEARQLSVARGAGASWRSSEVLTYILSCFMPIWRDLGKEECKGRVGPLDILSRWPMIRKLTDYDTRVTQESGSV